MGFLIKVAAGTSTLADIILSAGKKGFTRGTNDFHDAIAEQLRQAKRAEKYGTEFNGGAVDSLSNFQQQGWLRSLAESGTLNASDAAKLGYTGPINPAKAWTAKGTRRFIDTARRALDPRAADIFRAFENGQQVGVKGMRHVSDKLFVDVLEHLAGRNAGNILSRRDIALARFLAENPQLLRGNNGGINIGQRLASGRLRFNRDLITAVRNGLSDYRYRAGSDIPVPPKKPGDAPDVPPKKPGDAPDVPPKKPGDAPDVPPKKPGDAPDVPPGDKSKPGLLRWRNLGIGAGGLGLGGAAWYGATRPGEVSNEVEADSRNADVPLPIQGAEWNNTARAYYDRLRGDSSLQNQLYNVGMTSPSSLQRNLGDQLNYLSGPAPGVPLGLQPGVPIRLYQ